jgi:hypothetical protein
MRNGFMRESPASGLAAGEGALAFPGYQYIKYVD